MAPTCAPRGVPDRPYCEVQNSMCRQTLNERSERERQFALSCPHPVECPPLPSLAIKHANRSTPCTPYPNNSQRPPLRRTRHKQTVVKQIGHCRTRARSTHRTQCFCRPTAVDMSANALSARGDFAGNSALDRSRSRSSELTAGAVTPPSRSGFRVSNAIPLESEMVVRGRSKFGEYLSRRSP
jgi:hypothetical protein